MTAQLSPTGGRDVHTVRFPAATPPSEIDVLVVGAGPSGLGAAVELTYRGVQVAVIDQAREATLARAGAMGVAGVFSWAFSLAGASGAGAAVGGGSGAATPGASSRSTAIAASPSRSLTWRCAGHSSGNAPA